MTCQCVSCLLPLLSKEVPQNQFSGDLWSDPRICGFHHFFTGSYSTYEPTPSLVSLDAQINHCQAPFAPSSLPHPPCSTVSTAVSTAWRSFTPDSRALCDWSHGHMVGPSGADCFYNEWLTPVHMSSQRCLAVACVPVATPASYIVKSRHPLLSFLVQPHSKLLTLALN